MLFNDEAQDLVLDFCLGEDKPWKRLSAAQARQRAKKRPATGDMRLAVGDDELDVILDGSRRQTGEEETEASE